MRTQKHLFGHSLIVIAAVLITVFRHPCLHAAEFSDFIHTHTYGTTVGSVCVDKEGVAWLGTSKGVMTYDDLSNGIYHKDSGIDILDTPIHMVYVLSDNRLLIVTMKQRKYILDPIKWQIEEINGEWLTSLGIEADGGWDVSVAAHPEGKAVITARNKIFLYDPFSNKASLVNELEENIDIISVDSDCYHILTHNNIVTVDFLKEEISVVDKPFSAISGKAIRDNAGNIWLGDRNLYRYNKATGQWTTMKDNIVVTSIVKSGKDIYVGTSMSGLLHYKENNDIPQSLRNDPFDIYSPLSDHCRFVYVDPTGNLWLIYNKSDFSISSPLNNLIRVHHIDELATKRIKDDIISLSSLKDGSLIAGTDGYGIFRIDPDSGIQTPGNGSLPLDRILEKSITASFIDSKGKIWIGSYRNGLKCIDENKAVRNIMPEVSPFSIVEDLNGYIYVATSGDGLFRIDPAIADKPQRIEIGDEVWIQQLFCNRSGTIFVATGNRIYSIDANTLSVKDITTEREGDRKLKSRYFNSIYRDSRSLLWILENESGENLEIIDPRNGNVIGVSGTKGIDFMSIIEDENKSMWLASANDIHNIVPQYEPATKTYSFRHYIYHIRGNEGYPNTYNYRSVTKLADGRLVFGGINGYQIVNPGLYQDLVVATHPSGALTGLKVNNEPIVPGKEYGGKVLIENSLSVTDHISLGFAQNNISLLFSPRDYNSPFRLDYYYRLDSTRGEWRAITGNMIELNNLAPGHYKLEVSAMAPDGSMSEVVDTLEIEIRTPWYLSWWACLAYIAVLCGAIVLGFHYYTDRQKQKMRVIQAEKEMARQHQLNEMKLRFFTNISHDFRTPLSLIITPLESYMNDNHDSRSRKFLLPVHKNAVKLLNLVNQILDFRKLEVTGIPLRLSYCDIVGFVKEICSSFTLFSEDTGITLSLESDIEVLNMYFDKDKLTKIMMNLLSNAFKYTEKGGAVTVRIQEVDDNVRISVTDTGKGIPDKDKVNIFDRFYQSEQSNHTTMGCGIGLHIVKEFVQLHNGNVSVTDNYPKGSVFTVSLPIVKTLHEEECPADATAADTSIDESNDGISISSQEQPMGKSSILLVEDNQDFIDFMADALSDDYNVFKANNGREALVILEKESVDIVISDVMMDEMDGFELCKTIKNDISTSHIPVILLTARSLAEDEMKGLELGADDYVTKPFNMPVLLLRIKKLLDENRRSHDKFKSIPDISPSEVTITPLDEQFLSDAVRIVEENMSNPDFSVEMLSNLLNMHRTHLYKKLSCITGKTPIEFIRLIRLKRAVQYLGKSQMYISEIAYKVGFNNPRLFSKYFKEEFNMTPREYVKSIGINTDIED